MFDAADVLWVLGDHSIAIDGSQWHGCIVNNEQVAEFDNGPALSRYLLGLYGIDRYCLVATGIGALSRVLSYNAINAPRHVLDLELTHALGHFSRKHSVRAQGRARAWLIRHLSCSVACPITPSIAAMIFRGDRASIIKYEQSFGKGALGAELRKLGMLLLRRVREYGNLRRLFLIEIAAHRSLVAHMSRPIPVSLNGVEVLCQELDREAVELRLRFRKATNLDAPDLIGSGNLRASYIKEQGDNAEGEPPTKAWFKLLLEANPERYPAGAELLAYLKNAQALKVLRFVRYGGEDSLYAVYQPMGTVTGRVAMTEPAFQTLPRVYRELVRPQSGYVLRYFDYKCFEPSILANASGDSRLIEACSGDLYGEVASWLGLDPSHERKFAKLWFLMYLYGRSMRRLSMDLSSISDTPLAECAMRVSSLEGHIEHCVQFMKTVRNQALERGYVETAIGNRRKLAPNQLYVAINHYLQGTGALIFKRALCAVSKLDSQIHLVAPMHDGFVLAIPAPVANHYGSTIVALMKQVFEDTVGAAQGVQVSVVDQF